MSDHKAGDVVCLKSGGPKMTVDFFDTALNNYCCSWFEGTKRSQARFGGQSLKKADHNDEPGFAVSSDSE